MCKNYFKPLVNQNRISGLLYDFYFNFKRLLEDIKADENRCHLHNHTVGILNPTIQNTDFLKIGFQVVQQVLANRGSDLRLVVKAITR